MKRKNMDKELRILILEDATTDIELMEHELRKGGIVFTSKCVQTKETFLKELKDFTPDLILADYSLPQFDGLSALAIVKEQCPDVPFILVSGAIGEELAIETLKSGATDYVLKDRLSRLVLVINRALREIEERAERKQVEEALQKSEEKYRDLYENAPDGYHSIGPDGTILELNDTWLKMLGYERDEVIVKMKLTDFLTVDGLKIFQDTFPELKSKGSVENIEQDFKRKDGTLLPVLINATAIYDKKGNFLKSRSIVRDISTRASYKEKLERSIEEWRSTFDSMPYGVMLLDREFNILRTNSYISRLLGIPFRDIMGRKCYELIQGTDSCPFLKSSEVSGTETCEYYEARFNKYFMRYVTPFLDKEGLPQRYIISLLDITEIKDKERELTDSRDAFFNMLKDIDFSFKELQEIYNSLIFSLIYAIEAKSPWTKGHSDRVRNYALSISKELEFKDQDIETLRTAAILHDIGKIGTYDVILDKPGKLTDEEFALMKMHPAKGEEILKPIRQLGKILPIIRHHHERIDGKGYPDGLKGEEIPFCARILHVADSFDSMTADRPYRPAPGIEYAISELKKYAGTQFDPKVVEAFLRVLGKPQG